MMNLFLSTPTILRITHHPSVSNTRPRYGGICKEGELIVVDLTRLLHDHSNMIEIINILDKLLLCAGYCG